MQDATVDGGMCVLMSTRRTFLGAAAAFAAGAPLIARAQESEPRFSAATVRADLDWVWSTLLDVGADPFRTSQRSEVERLYRTTRASLTSDMNVREAWVAIAPILGALNDGHASLGFPDPLNDAPRRFPLRFALAEGGDTLIIVRDRSQTIPLGSRVVSVEGITGERYRNLALAAFGGQTVALHRSRVWDSGAWASIALFGDKPSYDVQWVAPNGAAGRAAIPGSSTPSAHATPASTDPYTYSTLHNGTVGYIDYRSCEDLPRFRTFLDTTFQTIAGSPVKALVIDIRRNGGGNSDLNDALWSYVTTKPFKQFGGMIEKSCARIKSEYGHDKYVQIYGEAAWNAPDGTILRSGMDPNDNLITPGPLKNRYSGPVYLLISVSTFSSAMSCASAAKDYGLATIVGEETGEPVNSTGEVYGGTTPGLGLRAYVTTKVYLAPKPHPNGRGVVPDIHVATTIADIAANRDPVMDRVFSQVGV
jgi:Peptidase family S41